jgi:hypothetical protein
MDRQEWAPEAQTRTSDSTSPHQNRSVTTTSHTDLFAKRVIPVVLAVGAYGGAIVGDVDRATEGVAEAFRLFRLVIGADGHRERHAQKAEHQAIRGAFEDSAKSYRVLLSLASARMIRPLRWLICLGRRFGAAPYLEVLRLHIGADSIGT